MSGFLKVIGIAGILALVSLGAWGGKLHWQINSTVATVAVHQVQLQNLDTQIKMHKEFVDTAKNQLIVFDMRLAKMERNLIRLCVAVKAKCED